ncbi:MAG: indole-3-glycerol-phosphate synthase TrpC [Clostridia bacterium]|nr:indole-3-glycerol-phosphate synthase TrpC [Clostridia bacterium]
MNLPDAILRTRGRGAVPVIAEVKRLIPKLAAEAGRGPDGRDAGRLAECYRRGGACGISLVTERRHFGGRPEEDVPLVLRSTPLPLLIKDFISEAAQVDCYARLVTSVDPACLGRVSLLLIAHRVGDDLPELLERVHSWGMLALVETRGPEDLPLIAGAEPWLVGINNKDIDRLEVGEDGVRIDREMLAPYRELLPRSLIVSESGHRTPEDVRCSLKAGADAVLAGTAFMLAEDPAEAVAAFVTAGEVAPWSG